MLQGMDGVSIGMAGLVDSGETMAAAASGSAACALLSVAALA
jgi:hypothetical protein